MLEIDIHFQRGDFELNFKEHFGEPVVGLFGASGVGKSTLLSLIAGFLSPSAGLIKLDGVVLFDSNQSINLAPHQRRIATVFQDGRLFPHLNVKDNLLYGFKFTPEADRHIDFSSVVALLDIEGLILKRAHELSGGEAQRVALGRALLMSPKLLLLDEPLSSLDVRLKQQILPFLKRIKDEVNIPMIYVSHDIQEVNFISDRVCQLGDQLG
ncbi:ATP-binding cassette domain-containing protein [Candidatus Methylopumilus turicensis]|uniref:Molybdate ABC transporter, ATP-binding protein n=1 Tax=Candidatus Methylopumilus turicensis TaxID=1581680 RepID=A0A0B7IZJ5_9PROT|nr:ATP-binding cassette domain-containing protein [Candidatus Methylopumilus turicensis]CEN55936.1 Molybdate ABC transporter, ATP-binding protein [Candidatus Methylopumilus turicensis]